MKALFLASTVLFSSAALADLPARLDCSNGQLGVDSYVQVGIGTRDIEFNMHETHLAVRKREAVVNGDSAAILSREVTGTAEGDQFTVNTSALLVYDGAKKTLNVTLVLDGHAQLAGVRLTCK